MDLCVVGELEHLQALGLIRFAAWALAWARGMPRRAAVALRGRVCVPVTKEERSSRAALPVEHSVVSVSSTQMRVCVYVRVYVSVEQ